MKKRIVALFAAAAMIVSSAMGVWAAGSASKNIVAVPNETTDQDNYYVTRESLTGLPSFVALQEMVPDITEMIEKVNAGEMKPEEFLAAIGAAEDTSEDVKINLEGKEMLTQVFDVDKVGEPRKENGKYRVTLQIPGLTAKTTGLGLVHLRSVDGKWEYIPAVEGSINLTKKTADFDFDSFSPVFLVADKGTTEKGTAIDSDNKQTTDKSPKTSQTSDWMVWAVMAVVLLAAGTMVLRRKEH